MKLTSNESTENYLETILILSKRLPVVRSIDIANEMNFSKASVSVAMKHLREDKQIEVSNAGFITLTKEGQSTAKMIYERHILLTEWLVQLGVSEKIAAQDACRIEHVISKKSFQALKKHIKDSKNHIDLGNDA